MPGGWGQRRGRIDVEIGEVYVLSAWVTVSSEPPPVESAQHEPGLPQLCTFDAVPYSARVSA
jgi:hypothetical protein